MVQSIGIELDSKWEPLDRGTNNPEMCSLCIVARPGPALHLMALDPARFRDLIAALAAEAERVEKLHAAVEQGAG